MAKDPSIESYAQELERKRKRLQSIDRGDKIVGNSVVVKKPEKVSDPAKEIAVQVDVDTIITQSIAPFIPSEKQKRYAEILLTSTDAMTQKEIAKRLDVGAETIAHWFSNVRFRMWVEELRMLYFFNFKPMIDKTLIHKALSGSYRHMELFYTLTGDLKQTVMREDALAGEFDSMGVSAQFAEFSRVIKTISGTMGKDEPQRRLQSAEEPDASAVPETP